MVGDAVPGIMDGAGEQQHRATEAPGIRASVMIRRFSSTLRNRLGTTRRPNVSARTATVDVSIYTPSGHLHSCPLLTRRSSLCPGPLTRRSWACAYAELIDQILIDRPGIALEPHLPLDPHSVRLAGPAGVARYRSRPLRGPLQSRWPGVGEFEVAAGAYP